MPINNKRMYCINGGCKLKGECARYTPEPRPNSVTKKFEETWNGKRCIKYKPKARTQPPKRQEQFIREDEPIAFYSTIPQEVELREHLVRQVVDNFDRLFSDMLASGANMNKTAIGARLVDFLMPKIISKKSLTRKIYK